jgi:hypothetical protein
MNKTIVYWNARRLGKEFELSPQKVGLILKSIGAKRWTKNPSSGSIWYFDIEEPVDKYTL